MITFNGNVERGRQKLKERGIEKEGVCVRRGEKK